MLAVIVPLPMLSMRTIVPAVTKDVAVQLKAPSLASTQAVPFHSLSSKIITSLGLMSTNATKAMLSLASALYPTNAIFPVVSAII